MSVLEHPYVEREGSEITAYADFAIEYRDASHRYWIMQGEDRRAAVSVTSALKILDKPALVSWAERVGIEAAVELMRRGAIGDAVATADVPGIVRSEKLGADAKKEAGGERGSAVHEVQRLYCTEEKIPNVGDFDIPVRPFVSGMCKWLLKARPEPVLVEQVVGSAKHNFAGRVDLLAKVRGELVVVDYKSSATGRVYPEHHLQIGGYRLGLAECLGIQAGGLVVGLGADGSFYESPSCAEPARFLDILQCQRSFNAVRDALRGQEKAAA